MQIMLFILLAFVLCSVICTVVCVFYGFDLVELLPVYAVKKKSVGASFWGAYNATNDGPEESFKLPKLYDDADSAIVGSTKYAMGKPVKSCRS